MKDCKILKNIIIKEIAGHGIRTLKNLELSKGYTCLNVHGYTGHLSKIIHRKALFYKTDMGFSCVPRLLNMFPKFAT